MAKVYIGKGFCDDYDGLSDKVRKEITKELLKQDQKKKEEES